MSWYSRGDEQAERAAQNRRDVLRGPVPQSPSARAEDQTAQSLSRVFTASTLAVALLVVLVAAATGYYAQYSGSLRWILYALVVGVVGLIAIRALRGTVQDPVQPSAPRAAAAVGGELASLRTTLGRARRGLAYSQILVEDRMRRAFLEKVRVDRGVSEDAMLAVTRDPGALAALVHDPELAAFVLESARNARDFPSKARKPPKKVEFARRTASVLDRMEAWR